MVHLVTGATGFIGSSVLRALLAQGNIVRLLCRPGSNRDNLAGLTNGNIEIVEGDLIDPASLRLALRDVSTLFHLAADYQLWDQNAARMWAVNVEGTVTLFRLAAEAGVTRMVHTSSVATLALNVDGTLGNETRSAAPEDLIGSYKKSKFAAEQQIRALIARETLPVILVHPSTPVGPRDIKPTPTGRLILKAASGSMPAYVNTGLNIVHVDDVAQGHLLAAEKGHFGESYILGGENMSLRSLLQQIASLTGGPQPWLPIPRWPLWPLAVATEGWARLQGKNKEPFLTLNGLRMTGKPMYFTATKAETELGFHARPAKEAFSDAISWFRAKGYCP